MSLPAQSYAGFWNVVITSHVAITVDRKSKQFWGHESYGQGDKGVLRDQASEAWIYQPYYKQRIVPPPPAAGDGGEKWGQGPQDDSFSPT